MLRRPATDPRGEMPFLDHLEELRWRVLWALLAIGAGSVVGFVVVQYFGVMELLIRPVRPILEGESLHYLSPATPFWITLQLSVVLGILLALPIVVHQVWSFFSPALEDHEKRAIVPALYLGFVLFCAGVAMAYFAVLPLALQFLASFQEAYLQATIEVGMYLGFVTKLLIAFGLVFELPVVVMILSALGLVTPELMRSKRRHAIVGMTIVASLLTPGDIVSTFLMIAPLIVLYEGSIGLSAMVHRKNREREEAMRPSTEPPPGAVETGKG